MWYAMREALALVAEAGLEPLWARHRAVHDQLWAGLSAMGLEPFVKDPAERLVTVNTIKASPLPVPTRLQRGDAAQLSPGRRPPAGCYA